MRAVVHDRYGPPDVLRLERVERPVPKDDEVLVRVRATTVNRTDAGLRSAEVFISRFVTGLRRPKNRILGMELAGEVAGVGPAVSEFAVGDAVFDGASLALVCLEKGAPLDGRSVLIFGSSGSVGTSAVQLAKHFGAHVTAVCRTKNVELARSLGADEVIDYTRDDFTKNGKAYDVIFDSVGKHSFRRSRRSLKPGGIFIETDLGFMWHVPFLLLATRWVGSKKLKMGIARYQKADLLFLKQLIEAGEYRAVIDRTYPLEDVIEATRYVESEQKTGNVVLSVAD